MATKQPVSARTSRKTIPVWATAAAALLASSCASSASEPKTALSPAPPEQATVEASASLLRQMRASPNFLGLDAYLGRARGVMLFPHVVKAAFVLGGAGGNGVLVSRDAQGRWSAPAFYSLGAGSAGLQLGYEEVGVVLVFMNDRALHSAIERGLTLGAGASIATGTLGDNALATSGTTAKDVYEFVEAGGVFAGVSLDGTVVGAREPLNRHYYGTQATTAGIVLDRRFDRPETAILKQALSRTS
jgi:lipid-binding SYLF domain-containing protein